MLMKIKINVEAAAVIIAFVAVLLALWEGYESRKHNRLSVIPKLTEVNERSFVHPKRFSVGIENAGLGPAEVREVQVYFNGRKQELFETKGFRSHFQNVFFAIDGVWPAKVGLHTQDTVIDPGSIIAMGKTLDILTIDAEENIDQATFSTIVDVVDHGIDLFVCYCSIYGDECDILHVGDTMGFPPMYCTAE